MTTATAPAPAEAEIREAIDASWETEWNPPAGPDTPRATLEAIIGEVAEPFVDSAAATLEAGGGSAWEPLSRDAGPRAFWRDLRPSQAVRLMDMVEQARARARERCEAVIVEELVGVGLAFAQEHPDAPRGEPAPETIVQGLERITSA